MKNDELRRLAIRLARRLPPDSSSVVSCGYCTHMSWTKKMKHGDDCPIAALEAEEAASKVKPEEVDDSHATLFSYPIYDKTGRRLEGCEYSSADRTASDGRKLWQCRGCAHRTTDPRKGRACDPSEWVDRNARNEAGDKKTAGEFAGEFG